MDNATSHSKQLNHPNVKIIFFPPNCTSLIQPLDQGVIRAFKAHYIRKIFETLFDRHEKDNSVPIINIWKKFCISDCIDLVSLACKEIKMSTFNAAWKPLLPQMVGKRNVIPFAEEQYSRIVSAAFRLGGEGFEDLNIQDVRELFEEQSLTEEELIEYVNTCTSNTPLDNIKGVNEELSPEINVNGIEKIIDFAKQLELCILENDS